MLPRCRWLAISTLFLVLTAPLFGQDTVDLKWKFEKGKTFYQTMTTDTDQELTVMGMKVNQKQTQTFYFGWSVVQLNPDKSWTVKQKIEGVKMDIKIGGNPITFDSSKDTNAANPLADFFKALVGSEFTLAITTDPQTKVTKIEGREEFLKKLEQANPQMKPLLQQILSDDALKQMASAAFAVVPGKPVKKGDIWTGESSLNMGPIGTYKSTYKYTDEGKDDKDKKIEKIKVETTLTYAAPAAGAAQGSLPFRIVNADLKSKEAGGTILFDVEKGRVSSFDQSVKLEGKLTIDISGMTSEVDLKQSQKTTMSTSDTNPVKKEEPAKTEEKPKTK